MTNPKPGMIHVRHVGVIALKMWVPGHPVTWKRPRDGAHGGRFSDPGQKAHQEVVAWHATKHLDPYRAHRLDDQFVAQFEFCTNTTIADVDNMTKLVLDALEGIVWKNDRQVWASYTCKTKVPKSEEGTGMLVLRKQPGE